MKSIPRILFIFLVLVLIQTACITSPQIGSDPDPDQGRGCSMTVVSDSSSRLFLEDRDDGTPGLLSQYATQTGQIVCVEYMSGPEAVAYKTTLLANPATDVTPAEPSAFLFDSNIYAEGLYDQKFVGNSLVGIWIHQSSVTRLGLTKGTPLTMEQYAQMMESDNLKMVTAPAYSSTPASMMFFATMSAFYGPYNQLTPEQVQDPEAIAFGKRIYDHYTRSAVSADDAIQMVLNDTTGMYDGVVGFESSFMGGRNEGLSDPFVFFYFDPSVISIITFGRIQLKDNSLVNYNSFAEFLTSESAQIYIASTGIRPQKNVVDLDPSLFSADQGLSVDPAVTIVNPPPYSIVKLALISYRDLYKRDKVTLVCVDVSPSMFQERMTIDLDGEPVSVYRIQALNRSLLEKITSSDWLARNNVVPGPRDVTEYYFFSGTTTGLVVSTTGTATDEAGAYIDNLIGPWDSADPTYWDQRRFETNLYETFGGFQSNSTYMFDCANQMLIQIANQFDPETDYYIVILTDGENMGGLSGRDFFNNWNSFPDKASVTLIGIAFGTAGKDVSAEYTQQFGGNTYLGDNDAELVKAFELIINR